jgi:hypothetical protein
VVALGSPTALVLILAAGAALAGTSGNERTAMAEIQPYRNAVEAVAPGLPELVGPFRRAPRASDEIPGDEVQSLQLSGTATAGEDPTLSRRLDFGNGRGAYVWPNRNGICYGFSASGGCSSVARLREQRMLVVTRLGYSSPEDPTLDLEVFALTVDEITHVEFEFLDGHSVTRAVTNNGLLTNVSRFPVSATWRSVGGTTGTVDIPSSSP